ncbi:MAG: ABC transporter substrate-binding protein [Sulfurospirillaceae bacterium]|nr:ABC transporter substrate-binding protein [Sulfurospirillaceae bacterium]
MNKIVSAIIVFIVILLSFYFSQGKFNDKEIRLGMSGPFSGNKSNLGDDMLTGAMAYFNDINDKGGIYGRPIKIIAKDDRYEPNLAIENAKNLIKKDKIFAFFGIIGTPTSRAILPIAIDNNIPLLGTFSGADFLREPPNPLILNARAGYEAETENLVKFFVDQKKLTRIAVFYQNDSYGRSGLRGIRKALDKRNLKIIGEGSYKRNTLSVGNALYEISLTRPEAIILVGTTMPVAEFIKRARKNDKIIKNIDFGVLSFISPKLLVETLNKNVKNVFFSQVVPTPWTSKEKEVEKYRELMSKYFPEKQLGYVSLEGYFAAEMTAEVFKAVGKNFRKSDFIREMEKLSKDIKNNTCSSTVSVKCPCLRLVLISQYIDGKFKLIHEK